MCVQWVRAKRDGTPGAPHPASDLPEWAGLLATVTRCAQMGMLMKALVEDPLWQQKPQKASPFPWSGADPEGFCGGGIVQGAGLLG